ncbi:40S ribosomal protein S10, partial [Fragariocoptes setiger]
MLMSKDNRKAIYSYLLEKGVMVAKKDFNAPRHPHVKEVPNLHVIKALQSLRSRGYVKEQFAWRHYYWYLTNEGIQYLRDYLHLASNTLPETLRKEDARKRAGKPLDSGASSDRPRGDAPHGGGYRSGGYRAAGGEAGGYGDRRPGFGRGFNAGI